MAKAVATVEDFDKLKNPDTGLVPMTFLVPTITELKGDVRGAEPYTALRWYNQGIAEPLKGLPSSKAPVTTASAESEDDARRSAVDLGSDPLSGHRLTKIAAAKKLTGADSMTEAEANDAIKAELDRRAGVTATAGANAGPNALTSASVVR